MESAKQLSKLLSDYQRNCLSGGFLDAKEIGEKVIEATKTDPNAPPLAKFVGSLGNPAHIVALSRYWAFRDQICAYQTANNISSVEWEEVTWWGEILRFPNHSDQLEFMPQDAAILARHKDKTLSKYLEFIQRHGLDLNVEENDGYSPIAIEEVPKLAKDYTYAWLGSGWERAPVRNASRAEDGSLKTHQGIAYYLTEFTLCLTDIPQPNHEEKYLWLKAIIEDPA